MTINKILHRLFFYTVLLSILSHCGFQLKKAHQFSPELKTLSMKEKNIDANFINELKQGLSSSGISFSEQADTTLHILGYKKQKRAASVNSSNARQTETRLTHELEFSLYHKDNLLIAPQSLSRSKEYINNNTNLSGKIQEERLLQSELDRELINLLLRRLENLDVDLTQDKADSETNDTDGT